MAAALVLSAGTTKLTYTDSAGTYITNIVIAQICNYEKSNSHNILIYTSAQELNLKFDTPENRDAAYVTIDAQFP